MNMKILELLIIYAKNVEPLFLIALNVQSQHANNAGFFIYFSFENSSFSYGKLLVSGTGCSTVCGAGKYLDVDGETCLAACAANTYNRLFFNACVTNCYMFICFI